MNEQRGGKFKIIVVDVVLTKYNFGLVLGNINLGKRYLYQTRNLTRFVIETCDMFVAARLDCVVRLRPAKPAQRYVFRNLFNKKCHFFSCPQQLK